MKLKDHYIFEKIVSCAEVVLNTTQTKKEILGLLGEQEISKYATQESILWESNRLLEKLIKHCRAVNG